jgi:endoglucanase
MEAGMAKLLDRRGLLGVGAATGLAALTAGLKAAGQEVSADCRPAPAAEGPDPVPMTWQRALERYRYGVALAGLEFGDSVFPGRHRAEVQEPPEDRYPYYASRGLRSVRLPYLWERLQPDLYGELDGALDLLSVHRANGPVLFRDVVRRHLDLAHQHGMKVLLDPHNYGARALRRDGAWVTTGGTGRMGRFAIGSPEVPVAAFADFCARLAAEYGDHPALLALDIMNEPVQMPGEGDGWFTAAQAAVLAVRRVRPDILLFIEGYRYANPFRWPQLNPRLHELEDPSDKLVFSAHLYFDDDHSGRYRGEEALRPGPRSTPARVLRDIQPFFDWLDAHGLRGHIGEFGAPDRPEWKPLPAALIDACAGRDLLMHAWADWPNNKGYVLQLNSDKGPDRAIVSLLSAAAEVRCT